MTALSIVQNVAAKFGISVAAVFASTDPQVIQLRTLMNEEGQILARGGDGFDHAWRVLVTETTFSTTAAAAQTGAVPSDFGWYINETMWNRTTVRKIGGPISPEEWQRVQANTATSIFPRFRFRGSSLLITPTPTASQTIAYEYVTKNWAQTSGAVGLAAMTADTDTALIEERLIELGLRWRYLKAKGLDYAEDYRTYQIEVGKAIARDGGRRRITLGDNAMRIYDGMIPEGSWNQ